MQSSSPSFTIGLDRFSVVANFTDASGVVSIKVLPLDPDAGQPDVPQILLAAPDGQEH